MAEALRLALGTPTQRLKRQHTTGGAPSPHHALLVLVPHEIVHEEAVDEHPDVRGLSDGRGSLRTHLCRERAREGHNFDGVATKEHTQETELQTQMQMKKKYMQNLVKCIKTIPKQLTCAIILNVGKNKRRKIFGKQLGKTK